MVEGAMAGEGGHSQLLAFFPTRVQTPTVGMAGNEWAWGWQRV